MRFYQLAPCFWPCCLPKKRKYTEENVLESSKSWEFEYSESSLSGDEVEKNTEKVSCHVIAQEDVGYGAGEENNGAVEYPLWTKEAVWIVE